MRSDWQERMKQSQGREFKFRYRVKEGAWVAGVFMGEQDQGLGPAWKKRLAFLILTVYGIPLYLYFALARPLKNEVSSLPDGLSIDGQPLKKKRQVAAYVSVGVAATPFIALVILASMYQSVGNSRIGGLRAPKIGATSFVGQSNCDEAVKRVLLDPESYERVSSEIVDVKSGEGWAAEISFRSRNGFGGYGSGTAFCAFDGSQYRALINE